MTDGEEISLGNEWKTSRSIDSGEDKEPTPHEWEVVSLTASTYAAAPGPMVNELIHEEMEATSSEDVEAETSQTLFMSRHFVFPPSEHENLPIDPVIVEKTKQDKFSECDLVMNVENEGKSQKEVEDWKIEGLNVPDEFPGMSLFDGKVNRKLSIHGSGYEDAVDLHGLNIDDKGQNVATAAKFSSFDGGTPIGGSAAYDESIVVNDLVEQSYDGADSSPLIPQSPEPGKEEFDDSVLPCGAWWKRGVASLCAQAKETNTFWSIFVAATVMGLVLLGQRWQQERWQILQQRWQLACSDEKSGRILFRLKDVIVGGSRGGAYITSSSTER